MVHTQQAASTEKVAHSSGIFVALIPWLLFTVVAEHGTLKMASIGALLIAIWIARPGIQAGKPKVLELGAVVTFAGFTVVAFLVDPSTAELLERYARAIAAALLALIAIRLAADGALHRAVRARESSAGALDLAEVQGDQPAADDDLGTAVRGDGPVPHRSRRDRQPARPTSCSTGSRRSCSCSWPEVSERPHAGRGGMTMRFFTDDDFQFGLEMVLGGAYRQNTDIGEVTGDRGADRRRRRRRLDPRVDGDRGRAWGAGETARHAGRRVTALSFYRRAATYYSTALYCTAKATTSAPSASSRRGGAIATAGSTSSTSRRRRASGSRSPTRARRSRATSSARPTRSPVSGGRW